MHEIAPALKAGAFAAHLGGVSTRSELHDLCREAGLRVAEETTFSRFTILVAAEA